MHVNLPLSKDKDIEIDTQSANVLIIRVWPGGRKKLALTEDELRAVIAFLEEYKGQILRDLTARQ